MDELKVCFIGFGSIAKRHIRNLSQICQKRNINLTVDLYRSGMAKSMEREYACMVHRVYYQPEKISADYDIIFITNPTEYHLAALGEFYHRGKNFFVEKPLTTMDKLSEIGLAEINDDKLLYVACPLRYKKVIQYVKHYVDLSAVYSVRVISSSYLPEWRPGIDYRDVYSAKKELGGGVATDLIHEWDYVRYLFGMPRKVLFHGGKVSGLDISSEDIALYIAEYERMMVEIHLDYFGREPIREMQLFTADDTIQCDLLRNEVRYLKSGKVIGFEEERDDFQREELECFLGMMDGENDNQNTVWDAVETLRLTKGEI